MCIIFGVFHEFFLKNFFIFSYYVFFNDKPLLNVSKCTIEIKCTY